MKKQIHKSAVFSSSTERQFLSKERFWLLSSIGLGQRAWMKTVWITSQGQMLRDLGIFAILLGLLIIGPNDRGTGTVGSIFTFNYLDKIFAEISSPVEFADTRTEEIDITEHPTMLSALLQTENLNITLPFFASYCFYAHLEERLSPLLTIAAENRIHYHPNCHLR